MLMLFVLQKELWFIQSSNKSDPGGLFPCSPYLIRHLEVTILSAHYCFWIGLHGIILFPRVDSGTYMAHICHWLVYFLGRILGILLK